MKRQRPQINVEHNCQYCQNWVIERKTVYDNGSEIITYKSPGGKGNCQVLKVDTEPDFGCNSFKYGDHIETTYKSGAPWQNWHYDVCPTCNGRGNLGNVKPPCEQCWGTGRVRYYDDGFIGEEKTKLHPNENNSPPLPPGPEITIQKIASKEDII